MSTLTTREKIHKYAIVQPHPNGGNTLTINGHTFTLNKKLDLLTPAECEQVAQRIGLAAYIARLTVPTPYVYVPLSSRKTGLCECGCGQTTRPGRRFMAGHDMRLKSALKKAAIDGDSAALTELKRLGWEVKPT